MTEPARLFLFFKCGCLARCPRERAAYWLEHACLALCPDCLDKKDLKPEPEPVQEPFVKPERRNTLKPELRGNIVAMPARRPPWHLRDA